ncbi:eukaryotic translation elongation factor 1 beta 2 [Capsaspora owczarzaki ATCC 30864]|uniref:Eukaryotic translation elongation factor 1 beta 2 n=1 Tax=Capsaspora owczarzaki (strain ATCC 30864) TaxID=595528 RepID=A0A0D2X4E3_CAPO3|nr:eukaryotic translation elongation factor 1 beta 2 [Capsaspora owczarzaki ATCC 30864]KJE95909.1 eukaryotic translation elongation factor 1 beta 2 [Capsaspora owczarzaki ATCC 30864]|eukprot:XP_004345051.2 eukaryotic translation elongation factor 1 beta 2 [Capsaspora owczarzaki ATCC 30864]
MAAQLKTETVWFDQARYEFVEQRLGHITAAQAPACTGASTSAAAAASHDGALEKRVAALEKENAAFKERLAKLEQLVKSLGSTPAPAAAAAAPAAAPAKAEEKAAAEEDDDIDLFGDDEEEDEETKKIKEARVAEYQAKKGNKPVLIAKSSILLDIKPWDDETDMVEIERLVRTIEMDGLVWGQAKLIPIGYGIKKLQINCVVEDDKVGTDILEEKITEFEDHVQSVDVAAFNKI